MKKIILIDADLDFDLSELEADLGDYQINSITEVLDQTTEITKLQNELTTITALNKLNVKGSNSVSDERDELQKKLFRTCALLDEASELLLSVRNALDVSARGDYCYKMIAEFIKKYEIQNK